MLNNMEQRNWLRELVEATLIGALVFVAIQVAVVNFRVEGSSMNPTLLPGHYLMVNKLVYFQLDTGRLGRIIPFWRPAEPRDIYLGAFAPPGGRYRVRLPTGHGASIRKTDHRGAGGHGGDCQRVGEHQRRKAG